MSHINPFDIPALIEQLERENARKADAIEAIKLQKKIAQTAQENEALNAEHAEHVAMHAAIAKQRRLQEAYDSAQKRNMLYREMCAYVDTPTGCNKGALCTYAHTLAQLRPKQKPAHDPSREKTAICRDWKSSGSCSRGNACWFLHENQLQPPPPPTLGAYFLRPRADTASALDESQSPVFCDYDQY